MDRKNLNVFSRHVSWLLACALLIACNATAQTNHDGSKRMAFIHERDVETAFIWDEIPRWDGEMLVGYYNNHTSGPIIYTMDRDGKRDETLFTFTDAGKINLYGIAGASDGEIVVTGSAYTADSKGTSFLARISPDRRRQLITRVSPFHPMVVALAADGTAWAIGHLKDNDNTHEIGDNVLRRFDPSGRVLSTAMLFVKGGASRQVTYLRASKDRVGWLVGDQYIEFSLAGAEIGRYDMPNSATEGDITGFALNDQDDVVAGIFGKGRAEFVALDRTTRSWQPLKLPKGSSPTWAQVLGFDGTTMVTNSRSGTLQRFKPE